jgi:hypothetical protein
LRRSDAPAARVCLRHLAHLGNNGDQLLPSGRPT